MINNTGTGPGSYPIAWAVYLSPDPAKDPHDGPVIDPTADSKATLIASGTTPLLAPAATVSLPFPSTGNFPATSGTYYFVAKVSAFDDTVIVGTTKKVWNSSPIIVSGSHLYCDSSPSADGKYGGGWRS